jgi:hypothetical protein
MEGVAGYQRKTRQLLSTWEPWASSFHSVENAAVGTKQPLILGSRWGPHPYGKVILNAVMQPHTSAAWVAKALTGIAGLDYH